MAAAVSHVTLTLQVSECVLSSVHSLPPVAVDCGYLSYLFLVMWVGLAASRTLPTFTTDAPDDGMKSIIDHLQAVLKEFSSDLNAVPLQTPNPL